MSKSVDVELGEGDLPEGSTRSRMLCNDLRLGVKNGRNPPLSVSSSFGAKVAVKPIDYQLLVRSLSLVVEYKTGHLHLSTPFASPQYPDQQMRRSV